jgi:hypothetical protein
MTVHTFGVGPPDEAARRKREDRTSGTSVVGAMRSMVKTPAGTDPSAFGQPYLSVGER